MSFKTEEILFYGVRCSWNVKQKVTFLFGSFRTLSPESISPSVVLSQHTACPSLEALPGCGVWVPGSLRWALWSPLPLQGPEHMASPPTLPNKHMVTKIVANYQIIFHMFSQSKAKEALLPTLLVTSKLPKVRRVCSLVIFVCYSADFSLTQI